MVTHHSVAVQREVIDFVLATSRKEAAEKYKIEESTIRSWVKKFEKRGGVVGSERPPKKDYVQKRWSAQFKKEIVEHAKTKSRREIQELFNVPGPTTRWVLLFLSIILNTFVLRMWVLASQGLDYRTTKKSPDQRSEVP